MSDAFNPYRAWLGVVSQSAPPTHYELLGLSPSRCDAQSVAEAFRRQMGRLNPHLSGEHAATAQRIAGELANARVVLLTPTTKRAYDSQLASQPRATPAAPSQAQTGAKTASASSQLSAASADDLLPPAVGPVAVMPSMPSASAPPPNQPPPPTVAPATFPAAPGAAGYVQPGAYPQAVAQPLPGAAVMGQPMPGGYQAAPGLTYGQPYAPQGYAVQPAYAAQQAYAGQVMPGQQPFPGQAVAAYPTAAVQPEAPAPLVSTGSSSASVSRMARSKRSSAAPLVVGVLIVGALATGAVIYQMKPDLAQVAAGDGGGAPSNASRTAPDDSSIKPVAKRRAAAVKPPKIAPVKANSSKEKLFSDDPDPMPGDPAAMPAEMPEKSTPQPDAPAERKPEMSKPEAKTPAADSPAATPEEKAAVGEALATARRALAERNLTEAEDRLAQATLEATAPELLAEVDRVQLLARYVGDFWNAVRQHMAKLESATTITVDGEELSIIESTEQKIIFRVAGKRREYTFEKLPPKLAYWLADTWLDKSNPAAFMTLGAYQAVAPQGDRQLARQLFEQAAAAGLDVKMLLAELDAQGEGK